MLEVAGVHKTFNPGAATARGALRGVNLTIPGGLFVTVIGSNGAGDRLTTRMVTHNLEHALQMGDRTIMMHEGGIVLDLTGPQRAAHTIESLLQEFARVRGDRLVTDRILATGV